MHRTLVFYCNVKPVAPVPAQAHRQIVNPNVVAVCYPFSEQPQPFVTSNLVFQPIFCLPYRMLSLSQAHLSQSRLCIALFLMIAIQTTAAAGTKSHTISFGKWITVQWLPSTGAPDDKPLTLKVRPLLVDTRVREFTVGPSHDVTDRLFVVRRAFRVNDSLPQEPVSMPHWQWQRGGWLVVDRITGHISPINLPEFDALYSAASWYRDYAAYCGVSDDGKKIYALVAQLNRRKPVLKKPLQGEALPENAPADSACPVPVWQRTPARVTFEPAASPKQTFAIRGRAADLVNESEEQEDEEASK